MTNTLSRDELRTYAILGVQKRLAEIEQEVATITNAFPELHQGQIVKEPATLGKRVMSRAERRAVSERMKRYWAERRSTKTSTLTDRRNIQDKKRM